MARNSDPLDDDALPQAAALDASAMPAAGPVDAPPRSSLFKSLGAMALVTVLAAAAGGLYGMQSIPLVTSLLEARAKTSEPPPPGRYAEGARLKDLAPIITNLSQPPETWIRLEASLILQGKMDPLPDVLVGEITNDILAYLRTLTLTQIEGPSGLRQLGEDLNERVSIRSAGRVRELVIQTLVIQ